MSKLPHVQELLEIKDTHRPRIGSA
jgi:hypothetical protein